MCKLSLRIENAYESGVVTTYPEVEVEPPFSGEDLQDWADRYLFQFTGTGRPEDARYHVMVLEGSGEGAERLVGTEFSWG